MRAHKHVESNQPYQYRSYARGSAPGVGEQMSLGLIAAFPFSLDPGKHVRRGRGGQEANHCKAYVKRLLRISIHHLSASSSLLLMIDDFAFICSMMGLNDKSMQKLMKHE